ncbi:NAD-dependent epimerase/dehydratase family protein [Thiohalomonas denitrificans]|uniref:Nucleoside-diphosphate-sugar epimerase n=1 Tax=Thiohalomonas denitrificans TaxID=415747 RepID=A0A1G5QXV4_9GAMM|nr:NAD-dependent epimerase/dehydratase family protein [Thiohalomonas denitrificans]SCZ66428.1 Nucleoside-diphosphate-sugar epimerase [Thiohalomonas denitrificans]
MERDRPIVLITGAGGRLGTAITQALGDEYRVVGLERKCGDLPDCLKVDITSDEAMARAFATLRERYGTRIASVIHLAAYFDFSGEPNPKYREVNVEGTRRLLRGLQDFQVEQFIYSSSMLVHAPTRPGFPLDEDSPLEPKWAYPQSKAESEEVVRTEHGDIPSVILRIAGVYSEEGGIPTLAHQVQRIFERQWMSHLFPGDRSHGQAAVHIDDVATAFRQTVAHRDRLPDESIFLIGEPETDSYASLQEMIGRSLHGQGWLTREIPKTVAAGGAWAQDKLEEIVPDAIDHGIKPFIRPYMVELADDHYELDIRRAREQLEWEPQHHLRDELPKMLESLKRDPVTWYQRNHLPVPPWLSDANELPEHAGPAVAEHETRSRTAHLQTLWAHFANASLGLWLMTSPFIFGLAQHWMEEVEPVAPGGRGLLWSHTWMTASDIITGLLIVIFALFSLSRDKGWARWVTAGLGLWLLFAPLLFWTPSAAAYVNDTLVGSLVILFAVAVPPAPGINVAAWLPRANIPPGWDYNPSGWGQRIPIIFLAFIGLIISRYLAAFQLGHIGGAWDPFFGEGTESIITSYVSEAWPVADAGLGATVYALEIVTGAIGDRRRWRTMPWLVLLFGFLIVPLGGTSLFFIIIQPVWLGTWCTLCLIAAAAMLIQIPYSFDEILATLQFLRERRRKGHSLLRVFFVGDASEGDGMDPSDDFERPAGKVVRNMLLGGVNVPWTLGLSILIGAGLMLTRLMFGTEGAAANSDHIVGALVISFSIMALSEVGRPLRFANVLLGAWAFIGAITLNGYAPFGSVAAAVAGLVLIGLSLPQGRIECRYADWNRWIR